MTGSRQVKVLGDLFISKNHNHVCRISLESVDGFSPNLYRHLNKLLYLLDFGDLVFIFKITERLIPIHIHIYTPNKFQIGLSG